jgi:soluble lytic murein transglycosylase
MRKVGCVALLAGCASVVPAYSQGVYSYVDGSGVKTLTNIPPQGPVQQLQLSPSALATLASLASLASIDPRSSLAGGAGKSSARTSRYDPIIEKYASQYQLDPSLIRSIITAESNFNERAVSRKGARGLMQLMPATAARHGVRDIYDPEENIRGGATHMRQLLDRFNNDLSLSLAAYNAGENLVERTGRIPNIRETQEYVKNVTSRYRKSQAPQAEAEVPKVPLFRYVDRSGVMHLTNIPPVSPTSESTSSYPLTAGSQMPD